MNKQCIINIIGKKLKSDVKKNIKKLIYTYLTLGVISLYLYKKYFKESTIKPF